MISWESALAASSESVYCDDGSAKRPIVAAFVSISPQLERVLIEKMHKIKSS